MIEQNSALHSHAAHTGETVHVDDRVQYVVVGDDTSLGELQSQLSLLPLCARGRVFIEIERPEDAFLLPVPLRMTVSWLSRSARSAGPGTAARCPRGHAVNRAVAAWSTEMLCDGPGNTRAVLTGDYRTVAGAFEHLVHEIGMDEDAIIAPTGFGLRKHPLPGV